MLLKIHNCKHAHTHTHTHTHARTHSHARTHTHTHTHRLYPVDRSRVNEYGESFDDEQPSVDKRTKEHLD